MSAKKMNKKTLALIISGVLLAAVLLWFATHRVGTAVELPADAETVSSAASAAAEEQQISSQTLLRDALLVEEIGSHTGPYWEDGSDEQVSDVLMIQVYNYGTSPVQYAEISLAAGDKTASFTLTTLPVGESMMVLESSRMAFDKKAEYTEGEARNVAEFKAPMSLCADKIQIQSLDGALNISNVSGKDITGDVFIYYKNVSDGVLFGGITYRVRIAGGMKAGEVRQVISNHYTGSSRLMFVTCE